MKEREGASFGMDEDHVSRVWNFESRRGNASDFTEEPVDLVEAVFAGLLVVRWILELG
jgi:hypothetical protein